MCSSIVKPLIVDALASRDGRRRTTRDAIGAGPRAVAGVLERWGSDPRVVVAEDFLATEATQDHDLLLGSGMTSDVTALRRVVGKWRKRNSGPVLLGGPVTSDPVTALRKTRADLAFVGEGEEVLDKLLGLGLSEGVIPGSDTLRGVRGIAFWVGGEVHVNPLRPVMPRSLYDDFEPSTRVITHYPLHHAARVYVEIHRGCSNYHRARIGVYGEACVGCEQCTQGGPEDRYHCPEGIPPGCGYCSVPSLYGPPKSRSVGRIVREVRELLSLGVRRVVLSAPGFLDYGRDRLVEPEPLTDPRSPGPNYQMIEELLAGLLDLPSVNEGQASIMIENIKASLVTERAADILGRHLAGTPVNVGFETGSSEHHRLLGRPDTPDEAFTALRRLKAAGLKPYVYFIHGLPGQTEKTVSETVEAIGRSMDLGAERVILYRFKSLPMSAFRDEHSGPPAARNPLSQRIYEAAQEANRKSKMGLLGSRMKVVIAEPYGRDHRYHVAYPLYHGPVVLVENFEGLPGEITDVTISGVASDRMVYGRA